MASRYCTVEEISVKPPNYSQPHCLMRSPLFAEAQKHSVNFSAKPLSVPVSRTSHRLQARHGLQRMPLALIPAPVPQNLFAQDGPVTRDASGNAILKVRGGSNDGILLRLPRLAMRTLRICARLVSMHASL